MQNNNLPNDNAENNPVDNMNFVPFKDALNLDMPVVMNNNPSNTFKFPDKDKKNNELYSYNEANSLRTPSSIIKNLKASYNGYTEFDNFDCSVDNIFKQIKDKSPGTLTLMEAYNIPFPIAKLIGRRFIQLTLDINGRSR